MRISRKGNFAVIDTGVNVYTAEITSEDRTPFSGVQPYFQDGNSSVPMRIGDFQIIPFGKENNMPEEIRKILDENHITPELLDKKANLLWGQGPAQYEVVFEEGKRIVKWTEDKEVSAWLKDWDHEDYLLKALVETKHINGHFTKYYRNRVSRSGVDPDYLKNLGLTDRISKLEHVSSVNARLEWPDDQNQVRNIITGDFQQYWKRGLKQYPIFFFKDPFRSAVSMRYSNMYTFALDNEYSRPPIYSILNWIKLDSTLPQLLLNYNVNAAAIRHHIKSPAIYWAGKEDQLKKHCELKGVEYKDSMLEDLKDDTFAAFAEGLIGIEKAGKMITSETIYDEIGQEYVGWEVITIDQKVKNYITAQIEIVKRAKFEITAAFGLHPALSNMSADGNLPSGSEQLYAFKLYLATSTNIQESIVCKDINHAIAVNFPDKNIKIGFYHDQLLTEEMTNPKDRIKNN